MLQTRLWMGSLLVVLAVGMLVLDQHLAPVYPFLLVFQIGLALIGSLEMILLLGPGRRPQIFLSMAGVFALGLTNWLVHWIAGPSASPWGGIVGCFAALVLAGLLMEMAAFQEANRCLERLGLSLMILAYLGLLPCFFAQLRWLDGGAKPHIGTLALALAIFVPKCCDIGAYFTGRLLGRHPMTPVLSPKKTWEGAIGGLTFAALVAVGLDRWGPVHLLQENLGLEIAFGITVGGAGMLGDLAESLIKRDCRQKDASQVIPGFGGVLDVVDAVIFAAPVSYVWLSFLV